MPIAIKDYTWDETETTVHITVPLKGVKASKADIFSTDEYIKVSFPPYLFEVALFAGVNDSKGSAQVGNGAIVFNLVKKEAEIWKRLTSPESGDKEVMKSKREAAIEAAHRKAEEDKKERDTKKREAEKYALREQMALEEQERKRIEETKNEERKKAMDELHEWKEKKRQEEEEEEERLASDEDDDLDGGGDSNKDIFDVEDNGTEDSVISSTVKSPERQSTDNKTPDKDNIPVPAPRRSGAIEVNFTPRVFPTPQRESYQVQEEEWLKKQAEARKVGVIDDDSDLTEEEKNPDWLKDKGDKFYKNGNYLAAVNAYNQAIKLNRKLPSLYSNRAACHLQVGNLMKCIEDCSTALELLQPPVQANANSRLKAHIRRGTAFCKFELYVEGLQDYEAALKIDPDNEQLKADADRIRHIIQGTEGGEDSS